MLLTKKELYVFTSTSAATLGEIKSLPQDSQVNNLLLLLISICLCGGTTLWQPLQADLVIVATALPPQAFLILVYVL